MNLQNITVERYIPNLHLDLAKQICNAQKNENPQMLPLNPEIMASHPYGAIAHISREQAVGYNAVTVLYKNPPTIEIGGLYVMPNFRGIGVFALLKANIFPAIVEEFPDTPAIVFANEVSAPKNIALGAKPINAEDLPTGALEGCLTCPKVAFLCADQLCCDTMLYFSKDRLIELGGRICGNY